ncbi:hypothetical protein B566_EDAN004191 [Ephemera danica]|nr:hypothetical protein B566_EDAN004191 [Ephemera danica]
MKTVTFVLASLALLCSVTSIPLQGLRGSDGDATEQRQSRQVIILWNPTPPPRSTTTTTPRTTPCQCAATGEYNPVCGTNNVTYSNPGRLQCAITCGTRVSLMHYGVCRT